MAIKNNRTCWCCRDKYTFCPSCSNADALKEAWYAEFCSEDCKTIWQTAVNYNLNKITKSEAKSVISAITLKPVEQYAKCIQRDFSVILAEDPKPKRGKRSKMPILDEVIPDIAVEDVQDAISDCEIHEVIFKENE